MGSIHYPCIYLHIRTFVCFLQVIALVQLCHCKAVVRGACNLIDQEKSGLMGAGQDISQKHKSSDIQQAAQQDTVKENSTLKLLGT